MDRDDLRKWAKRLHDAKSNWSSPDGRLHQQPRELLTAFKKIGDPVIREQLLILVEIISERPELLAKHYLM